jgi:endonuclease YncB( thermonuclease family)
MRDPVGGGAVSEARAATASGDRTSSTSDFNSAEPREFECAAPRVTDGDTLRCGALRVRLAAIDAPELPGHCRPGRQCVAGDPYASSDNLRRLIANRALSCRRINIDHYGRTVAACAAAGVDLSCAQVAQGFAVERYGHLVC